MENFKCSIRHNPKSKKNIKYLIPSQIIHIKQTMKVINSFKEFRDWPLQNRVHSFNRS